MFFMSGEPHPQNAAPSLAAIEFGPLPGQEPAFELARRSLLGLRHNQQVMSQTLSEDHPSLPGYYVEVASLYLNRSDDPRQGVWKATIRKPGESEGEGSHFLLTALTENFGVKVKGKETVDESDLRELGGLLGALATHQAELDAASAAGTPMHVTGGKRKGLLHWLGRQDVTTHK